MAPNINFIKEYKNYLNVIIAKTVYLFPNLEMSSLIEEFFSLKIILFFLKK